MTSHERYAGTTILLCLACSDLKVRSYMDGVGMDEHQHDPKAKLRIRVCAYRQQDWKQLHTQLARAIMRATHAQHYARHWCFCPQFISQSQVVGVVEQRRIPVALYMYMCDSLPTRANATTCTGCPLLVFGGCMVTVPEILSTIVHYVNYWFIVCCCCGRV